MSTIQTTKNKADQLERRYCSAIQKHIKENSRKKPAAALALGHDAVKRGLDVLDLVTLHEGILIDEVLKTKTVSGRQRIVRRAAKFLAEAIVPFETTHRTAIENNTKLLLLNRELEQRAKALSVSHRKLNTEINKRRVVEQYLRKSESESKRLLTQSQELQEDLRRLSRRILITQEEERKRISRELHDIVAQTLTAINLHLATLKGETVKNASGMKRDITRTQRIVERSVDKVYRFARELRPAVLDDLGLIPALRSLIDHFASASDIRITLTTCSKVQFLNNDQRTVLYRVAQEALTNALRHACATHITVQFNESPNAICMKIIDDGHAFDVERVLRAGKYKRMGLLGMRERVEMVNGTFTIDSTMGQGTTIAAQVPVQNGKRKGSHT